MQHHRLLMAFVFTSFHLNGLSIWGQTGEKIPAPLPPFLKLPEIPEGLSRIPGETGEFRLYLNSIQKPSSGFQISFPDNKLESQKQKEVPAQVWVPAITNKNDKMTTWSGPSPFEVTAKEIELWIRLSGSSKESAIGTVKFSVIVLQDGKEIATIPFTLSQKDFELGDEQEIQVLVRQPVEAKTIAKGTPLTLSIVRDGDDKIRNVSIWGVGRSHIEFRPEESDPATYQTVFGVVSIPEPKVQEKPKTDQTKNSKPEPAKGKEKVSKPAGKAAPPKPDKSQQAASKLNLAKKLLDSNKTKAIQRLEEIVKDFEGTEAAVEAKKILEEQK